MKWREDVPLTNADYARIRANVMAKVRRPTVPLRRYAIALAALAIVLTVLFIRLPVEDSGPRLSPRDGQPGAAVLRKETTKAAAVLYEETPAPQPTQAPVALVAHKRRHRSKHASAVLTATATRIDIQTADPDVRIIWFAR